MGLNMVQSELMTVPRHHPLTSTCPQIPWYAPLDPNRLSLTAFRTTGLGRLITRGLVNALELLRVRQATECVLDKHGLCVRAKALQAGLLSSKLNLQSGVVRYRAMPELMQAC
jgi:hypothetical protein